MLFFVGCQKCVCSGVGVCGCLFVKSEHLNDSHSFFFSTVMQARMRQKVKPAADGTLLKKNTAL